MLLLLLFPLLLLLLLLLFWLLLLLTLVIVVVVVVGLATNHPLWWLLGILYTRWSLQRPVLAGRVGRLALGHWWPIVSGCPQLTLCPLLHAWLGHLTSLRALASLVVTYTSGTPTWSTAIYRSGTADYASRCSGPIDSCRLEISLFLISL